MKMMMLLLISTVAMLVGPAVASPTAVSTTQHNHEDNLNSIFDLAGKYKESVQKELFVDDVSHLMDGTCKDSFFCKVHDILHTHKHPSKWEDEEKLVRNLKIFLSGMNPNCTVLLQGVTSTSVKKPIPILMDNLKDCIRRRNISRS